MNINLFQVLALAVVAGAMVMTVAAGRNGWASRRMATIWLLVWMLAAAAVAWPVLTQWVAGALGISRGADLVFYTAVVAMLIGFLMVYVRLRRIRRDITVLVRHLAIREAYVDPAHSNRDG